MWTGSARRVVLLSCFVLVPVCQGARMLARDVAVSFWIPPLSQRYCQRRGCWKLSGSWQAVGVKSGFFLGLARLLHSSGCLVICCPNNKLERG